MFHPDRYPPPLPLRDDPHQEGVESDTPSNVLAVVLVVVTAVALIAAMVWLAPVTNRGPACVTTIADDGRLVCEPTR